MARSLCCGGSRIGCESERAILKTQAACLPGRNHAGTNACAASRINCDCMARLSLRCWLHSLLAALLKAPCVLVNVVCCFALRWDPHSIACSVLRKIGIRRVLSASLYAALLCHCFIDSEVFLLPVLSFSGSKR